jgi:site-specific DNA-cytosine methylase
MDRRQRGYGVNLIYIPPLQEGDTLATIMHELRLCGYIVFYNIISARVLVPQARERIYFVGFRNGSPGSQILMAPDFFKWPELPHLPRCVQDVCITVFITSSVLLVVLKHAREHHIPTNQMPRCSEYMHHAFHCDFGTFRPSLVLYCLSVCMPLWLERF